MKSIEYEVNPLQQNQSNCQQHKISELWLPLQHKISELWHPHPLQQNQINRSLSRLGELWHPLQHKISELSHPLLAPFATKSNQYIKLVKLSAT